MYRTSEDLRYGFVNGRVRALETALLDHQRYERLVRASSSQEFRSLLADTVYGRYLAEDGTTSVERALAHSAADAIDFVSQYCEDEWLLQMFRMRVDFHNLKTVVKEGLAGREVDADHLRQGGDWDLERLEALASGQADAGPAEVRKAVVEAVKAATEEANVEPAVLDVVLDRLEQKLSLDLASGSRFVMGYLDVHADVENIRTLVRTKVLREEKVSFERALLAGGTVVPEELLDAWNDELDSLPSRLRRTMFGQLAEEGIAGFRRGTMLKLERRCREYKLSYLLETRYMTFGHEPLFAYYHFRENEADNLRQLHAAKQAGLEEALCREMVAQVG